MSISRRSILGAAAASAGASGFQQKGSTAPLASGRDSRPNFIFVITDDLRYDGVACTGHAFAKTPNIDRIAREGVTFSNFFTVVPLCSPSRASFLTGRYPHAHRIINNDKNGHAEISHTLLTFPRLLRDAGYETAFVGKWHMGFDDSRRPGFDHWVSFHAQGLYINPVVNVDGHQEQLRGYMTDFLNEKAVRFIERRRRTPFCLYVSHKAVHYPYLPAERHNKLYPDVRYVPPSIVPGDLEGKRAMSRKLTESVDVLRMEGSTPEPQESRRGRPETPDEVVRDQARCLASVDEGIAQILDALKRTGELDNTVIVFTSDNGYLMGEHGQFDQKRWAYEESIRVPLLMRYPKLIEPGSRRSQMTLNIDLAPTMLDLAGVTPSYVKMHGKSLRSVLKSSSEPLRTSFLAEHFVEKFVPGVPDWRAVRTERWKYIHYPDLKDMDELYDLSQDPRETRNVIADDAAREPLQQLRKEMGRLLDETTEQFG